MNLHTKTEYQFRFSFSKKKGSSEKPLEGAKIFLQEIKDCKEKKYPSAGQGWDYRFEGKDKVGSALVYRQRIIHMAFLR